MKKIAFLIVLNSIAFAGSDSDSDNFVILESKNDFVMIERQETKKTPEPYYPPTLSPSISELQLRRAATEEELPDVTQTIELHSSSSEPDLHTLQVSDHPAANAPIQSNRKKVISWLRRLNCCS